MTRILGRLIWNWIEVDLRSSGGTDILGFSLLSGELGDKIESASNVISTNCNS
jgi:hypothetical protein